MKSDQEIKESILAKFEGSVEECRVLNNWVANSRDEWRQIEEIRDERARQEAEQQSYREREVSAILDGFQLDRAIRHWLEEPDNEYAGEAVARAFKGAGVTADSLHDLAAAMNAMPKNSTD